MLKLLIVAVVVAVVAADLDTDWIIFKAKYNKKYASEEEVARKYIWTENMKYVEEHNKLYSRGLSTYVLGENEYADMTNTEFVSIMNGMKLTVNEPPVKYVNTTYNLPDTVDWVTKGYVTPVKNQGQCGSCWSFSTTGAIEGQHFKSTGNLVSLSESNLVDCSEAYGNQGCNGGFPYRAFQYVIAKKGIDTEGSYPYQPKDNLCRFSASNIGATISSYKEIPRGSESALQEAVAQVGPISVCIDATHVSFQMYRAGVYYERQCSSTKLDHAVLAVGYGTEDNQAYWLVKNSWGTRWGMNGYIKMIRNQDNNCGIATQAAYPLV